MTLTLTAADLRPDPRNAPAVLGELAGILRGAEAPRAAGAARSSARGLLRLGPSRGNEPELPPGHAEPRPAAARRAATTSPTRASGT